MSPFMSPNRQSATPSFPPKRLPVLQVCLQRSRLLPQASKTLGNPTTPPGPHLPGRTVGQRRPPTPRPQRFMRHPAATTYTAGVPCDLRRSPTPPEQSSTANPTTTAMQTTSQQLDSTPAAHATPATPAGVLTLWTNPTYRRASTTGRRSTPCPPKGTPLKATRHRLGHLLGLPGADPELPCSSPPRAQ